ncbi:phage infection protein [Brevibacillus reuszeri]|uniref:Phage infection protein n=1 Tax=Brevibacillus reuszeri TaxID=54915 RepID=A0A0K9YSA0_9BACL|nr:YhgE/Pip domain-containing protein [Brevibacillus reuszeri]KNB71512.1 phage infection protein [Brevibacillus reuszeri]MED1855684.1 YhgE/Pip domain-containing protein [Brevibacillus reuszeri]GED67167.1 phage infection protein [Brevibacillus reuszeri]
MRSIWQIYKTDWLNIFKVPTGIFLIIAIILLPCLYDWVNIKSVWDPYANTQGVKVAVTSEDQGTIVADKQINIGDELIKSLRTNEKLGWTFVTKEQAERGVDRGDYYASILIPSNFSSKITGIINGNLERPEVIYTVNEKVNAVAPKITSSGVSAITKQINENFTEAVSTALLTKLTEIGIQIEEQLPTIRKIENGIFTLEKRLPEIRAAGQKVLELEKKLPAIHDKAQIIIEVEKRIPEINRAAEHVLRIQENWPRISEAATVITSLEDKLPVIHQAVARVQELDQNFDKVANAITLGTEKASQAIEIVSAAQNALPKIADLAEKGTAVADQVNDFLTTHDGAFETIAPVLKQNLVLAQQAADAVTTLTDRLLQINLSHLPTADEVNAVKDRLVGVEKVLARTSSLLDRLNSYIPGQPLTNQLERLKAIQQKVTRQIDILGAIADALAAGKTPAKDLVEALNQLSKETSTGIQDILSRYDSEIVPRIEEGIEKMKQLTGDASANLKKLLERLPDIEAILADTKSGLEFGLAELKRIEQELPRIRSDVHELAQSLQSKADAFEKAIKVAAPFLRENLPGIGKKLDEAAAFIKNDLPGAEQELTKLADFVRNKLPEVETGVHKVAGLVRDDLPTLEKAIGQAADKLREVEANNNFADLAKLLRGDIKKESEFLASPVQIKENRKYPIPNYGSAMSPFYGVLSLWVGATLLISLLKPDADNPDGRYKPYQLYLGRLGTFMTIGLLQALCVTLGDFYILDAYVADKLPFVLFAMLVSMVFVTITYTLLSVFGNVGKGIAIIFMVFQFSSSGGTFPISMTAPFFQALNPFMPFTYAISLLREAVGGIFWETALRDILFLVGFIGISLFVALALKRPLSGLIKKSTENAKKTKIIA